MEPSLPLAAYSALSLILGFAAGIITEQRKPTHYRTPLLLFFGFASGLIVSWLLLLATIHQMALPDNPTTPNTNHYVF